MRFTADTLLRIGLKPWLIAVTFNGRRIGPHVAFDPEAGTVERYLRDGNGLAVVSSCFYVRELLRGEVTVDGLPEGAQAAALALQPQTFQTRRTPQTLLDDGVTPAWLDVCLDGRRMADVMAFDETAGTIERLVRNADGVVISNGDSLSWHTLTGDVAAYLVRPRGQARWPHATPAPPMDALPRVCSILR